MVKKDVEDGEEEGESDSDSVPPTPPLTRQQRAALLEKKKPEMEKPEKEKKPEKKPSPSGVEKKKKKQPSPAGVEKKKQEKQKHNQQQQHPRRPRSSRNRTCRKNLHPLNVFVSHTSDYRILISYSQLLRKAALERSRKELSLPASQQQGGTRPDSGAAAAAQYASQKFSSGTDSYGPYHDSVNLFPREALMAGRTPTNAHLKQNTRSEKKEGGVQMPYLSSALLSRPSMNAYGYGCPVMIDPDERLLHRKLQFKIKKANLVKPEVFNRVLSNRARALKRKEREPLRKPAPKEEAEPQPDPEVVRRQILAGIEEEESKQQHALQELRGSLASVSRRKLDASRNSSRIEQELKRLHMKRKNLVVELKHVASMMHQQHHAAAAAAAAPPQEIEEGEVKAAAPSSRRKSSKHHFSSSSPRKFVW